MKIWNWQAIKGLLNKDINESRLLIIGLILLLVAGRLMQSALDVDRYLSTFLQYSPCLLIALWGATNGDPRNHKRLYERTHLPVSVYRLWLVSFAIPIIILSSIVAVLPRIFDVAASIYTSADLNSMPVMLGIFAFSYFIASVSSQRLALVVGVIGIICGQTVLQFLGSDAPVIAWIAVAGSAAAVLLSLVLKGIIRADFSRALCIAIVVIAVFVPLRAKVSEVLKHERREPFVAHSYTAANKTITIKAINSRLSDGKAEPNMAEFRDTRTGVVHTHIFKAGWHAAWVDRRWIAYFLESDPTNQGSEITQWDIKTDKYRIIMRLPLQPDFETLCKPGHFASVDPSGRYMIARLPAVQNSSVDLWLIDLKHGRGRVVIQNAAYFNPNGARWLTGRALVPSYRSRIIEVALPAGTAAYLSRMRESY